MMNRVARWFIPISLAAGFSSQLLGCHARAPDPPPTQPAITQQLLPSAPDPAIARDLDLLVSRTLAENRAWMKLEHLCDDIGNRISGSAALDRAIEWALKTLSADGHENVRREPVMVPRWVRGEESLELLAPTSQKLMLLGLGNSVSTPPEGITASVLSVSSPEELENLGERARGKIILFDLVMPSFDAEKGSRYGESVQMRLHGPRLAAEKGAVGCLVRSVTARSLRTPHTGATDYGNATTLIPGAAISIEDATMISRLLQRGTDVKVRLKMQAHFEPDVESANVLAEIRGRELPDQIVVIGGHLDSWDVGQGAHDDGAGCVIAMEALTRLRELNLIPRRTVRVVLWTNEENGLRGARQYALDHKNDHLYAAIEADSGAFMPEGLDVEMKDDLQQSQVVTQLQPLAIALSRHFPYQIRAGFSGADIRPLKDSGAALLGFRVDGSTYFDYHHTPADTLDKVRPTDLDHSVAAMAAVAWYLAEVGYNTP